MATRERSYKSERIEGWEILVGKGDRENEDLTFRVGAPKDFWLHVAGLPGSHVVIRNPEGLSEPPREVLERAAELAVWHSKARGAGGKVPVHVCRVADVSKPRGAPRGQVRLRTFRTVKVYAREG